MEGIARAEAPNQTGVGHLPLRGKQGRFPRAPAQNEQDYENKCSARLRGNTRHVSPTELARIQRLHNTGGARGKEAAQSLRMGVSKVMALGKGKSADSAFTLDPETLLPESIPQTTPRKEEQSTAG